MADTVTDLLVRYWATGFFIVATLGLCAFMVGASSLLGGVAGVSANPSLSSPASSAPVMPDNAFPSSFIWSRCCS